MKILNVTSLMLGMLLLTAVTTNADERHNHNHAPTNTITHASPSEDTPQGKKKGWCFQCKKRHKQFGKCVQLPNGDHDNRYYVPPKSFLLDWDVLEDNENYRWSDGDQEDVEVDGGNSDVTITDIGNSKSDGNDDDEVLSPERPRRKVIVVDTFPPPRHKTDVGGQLLIEHSKSIRNPRTRGTSLHGHPIGCGHNSGSGNAVCKKFRESRITNPVVPIKVHTTGGGTMTLYKFTRPHPLQY